MTLERPAAALAGGAGVSICTAPATSVAEKVAFLSRPDAYPHRADEVVVRETYVVGVSRRAARLQAEKAGALSLP